MSDDLTIVNFEGTLTNTTKVPQSKRNNEFLFNIDPEAVSVLTENGVEAVSLDNNHVRDHGEEGLADTKATLDNANFLAFSMIVLLWCGWGVYTCGWSIGVQHFLIVLILLLFFNICISPKIKVLLGLLLLGYRISLYAWARSTLPANPLSDDGGIIFQTANSTVFFLLVAIICIILSSSIQDTERRLRIDNETLYPGHAENHAYRLPCFHAPQYF